MYREMKSKRTRKQIPRKYTARNYKERKKKQQMSTCDMNYWLEQKKLQIENYPLLSFQLIYWNPREKNKIIQ